MGVMGTELAQAVPALRKALSSAAEATRAAGGRYLGPRRPSCQRRRRRLAGLLRDNSPEVRRQAAYALGDLGEFAPDRAPALQPLLNDADDGVVCAAAYALFRVSGNVQPLLPVLEKRLNGNVTLHKRACYALGQMGPAASSLAPALARSLDYRNQYFRWWPSVAALGKMDKALPDAETAICASVKDFGDDSIAHAALAAIEGKAGDHLEPILRAARTREWLRAEPAIAAL